MPRFEHDSGLYAYEMIEMPSSELATSMRDYYSFESKVLEIARSKKQSGGEEKPNNEERNPSEIWGREPSIRMRGDLRGERRPFDERAFRGDRGDRGQRGGRGGMRGFRGGRGGLREESPREENWEA
jgi:hypothetical protein